MAGITLLHASDLHLDASVAAPDPAVRPLADRARRMALQRLLELSRNHGVKAVLLPGDVFQVPDPPVAARMAFVQACQEWLDMGARVFISPGNHDPIAPGSFWQSWTPPPGVTLFGPEPSGVELGDLGLWIAGAGFERAHVSDDLAAGLPGPPPGLMGLACQHCDLPSGGAYDAGGPYAPTRLERLVHKGFAYWALGHWHKPTEFSQDPPVVMAGSPQGGHFNENGPHGAYLLHIEHGALRHEFHALAPLTYFDLVLDQWDGLTDQLLFAQKVSGLLQKAGHDPNRAACVRLNLSGPSPLWRELQQGGRSDPVLELKDALGVLGLVLRDQGLKPAMDLSGLSGRDDVLGRVWRLIEQAESDPAYMGSLAQKLESLHPAGAGGEAAGRAEYLRSLLDQVRALSLSGLMPEGGD